MAAKQRPVTRYRPAWRLPVGETRTIKQLGDVEITSSGFERLTADGFKRIDLSGGAR